MRRPGNLYIQCRKWILVLPWFLSGAGLKHEVVGVVNSTKPGKTVVLLRDTRNRKLVPVGVNKRFDWDSEVLSVSDRYVEIRQGRRYYTARIGDTEVPKGAQVIRETDDVVKVDLSYLRQNLSLFSGPDHVVPYIRNDMIEGYSFASVPTGSLLDKMGFAVGDTVFKINSLHLDGFRSLFSMVDMMKTESELNIEYKRWGEPKTMTVYLE